MKHIKKKILLGILVVVLIVAVALGSYLNRVAHYQQAVEELTIQEIPLDTVADGTYVGSCDVDFIRAQVEVTVEDGQITSIVLLSHENGRGQPAEAVLDRILQEQRLGVDAVSGATNSSTVLKKAVEQALFQGVTP